MPLDLADIARRAAEAGGPDAVASVSLRREVVVICGPEGALAPPRRTYDLLVRLAVRDQDGRLGVARCSKAKGNKQLAALAQEAREQAAAGPRGLLATVAQGRRHEGFDERTASLDPLHAVATATAAAAAITAPGARAHWRSEDVELAVASSSGNSAVDRRTGVVLCVRGYDERGTAVQSAQLTATDVRVIDPERLAAEAARLATLDDRAGQRPGSLLSSPADHLVLLPPALAPLLEALADSAFTATRLSLDPTSFAGRLGERVAATTINLSDSPRFTRTLPRSFDVEGVPATPVPLIQDGIAHRVVHDTQSAAAAGDGATSTGHATELGGSFSSPRARNLVLAGGGAGSLSDLMAPVSHGIAVAAIDSVTLLGAGRITAVGRGAVLISGGAAVRPVGDVLLVGELSDLLGHVEEMTSRTDLVGRLNRLPERTSATVCGSALTRGLTVIAG
jgi:predicted Zn-dependent protease